MFSLVGAAALLCLSCTDGDPVGPGQADLLLAGSAAGPVFERGCARFEVQLSGRDRVEVRALEEEGCGPVQPVLGGTPTFDRTKQTVRLPIALENSGKRKVKAPAWLLGWEDSLAVISPRGLAENRQTQKYLGILAPDSTAEAADTVLQGARIWKYDQHLAAAGQTQTLAAGQRSGVRWVELSVHAGVERFRVALHARARRASNPVPLLPPDSTPRAMLEEIFAEENRFYYSQYHRDWYLRNVIRLYFHENTSQDLRQEAVDLIDGDVIGGKRLFANGGLYLIRIEDDGTDVPLRRAIEQLRALPQVYSAGRFYNTVDEPRYRKPEDEGDWAAWQVLDTLADGKNEALEAIAAPLAWGCETGSVNAPVAVTDVGFSSPADLTANISSASGRWSPSAQSRYHGTGVTSVIGAVGNNRSRMTGVMWEAGLRLYDYSETRLTIPRGEGEGIDTIAFESAEGADAVLQAAYDGAKVINLSWGPAWPSGYIPGEEPHRQADIERVREYERTGLRETLAQLREIERRSGNAPLFVIAAGNEEVDAFFARNTLLADSLPDRVLVVGAATHTSGGNFSAWKVSEPRGNFRGSNYGRLVNVGAPGGNAYVLNQNNQVYARQSTSFAAPYVTGVAGLLLSFDPRLAPAEVKDLIVHGAVRGGRTMPNYGGDPIPVLNAYESLKLAAERPGAPLCGNRMWYLGSNVVIQRGTGPTATSEVVNAQLSGVGYGMEALHGGRRIRVWQTADYESKLLEWSAGGWTIRPDTVLDIGPAILGSVGLSHGRDTSVYINNRAELRLRERQTRKDWLLTPLPLPTGGATGKHECVMRQSDKGKPPLCVDSVFVYSSSSTGATRPAYSPMGDRVLLYIGKSTGETHLTSDWYLCPGYETMDLSEIRRDCRDYAGSSATGSGTVYSISIPGGEMTPLVGSIPKTDHLVVAENGREFFTEIRGQTSSSRTTWVADPIYFDCRGLQLGLMCAPGVDRRTSSSYTSTCRGDFRDLRTGQSLFSVGSNCRNHEGTFSPDRVSGAQGAVPAGQRMSSAASPPRQMREPPARGRPLSGSRKE